MMFGFGSFIFGGLLNLVGAIWFIAAECKDSMGLPKHRKVLFISGNILSLLVVAGQLGMILFYLAKKAAAP